VSEIFSQHNLTKRNRRRIEKLETAAIGAETVVDQIGEDQERVCGRAGERAMSGVRFRALEWRRELSGPRRKTTSMKIGMINVRSMGPLRAR
jgi:hypothetical protein